MKKKIKLMKEVQKVWKTENKSLIAGLKKWSECSKKNLKKQEKMCIFGKKP